MLTEATGVPVGLAVAGANRHDVMLLEATHNVAGYGTVGGELGISPIRAESGGAARL